jgi:hypothetical protein
MSKRIIQLPIQCLEKNMDGSITFIYDNDTTFLISLRPDCPIDTDILMFLNSVDSLFISDLKRELKYMPHLHSFGKMQYFKNNEFNESVTFELYYKPDRVINNERIEIINRSMDRFFISDYN